MTQQNSIHTLFFLSFALVIAAHHAGWDETRPFVFTYPDVFYCKGKYRRDLDKLKSEYTFDLLDNTSGQLTPPFFDLLHVFLGLVVAHICW
jgi:hypothetical protein